LLNNTCTIKENIETVTQANKEIRPERNSEESKYIVFSGHQKSGQSDVIKIANRSSEYEAQNKCTEMRARNQNLIHEEIAI
jgi:50S ribosomal subunit-associated GTPase HflX